jgi:predicted DNA-binding protein (MmcQ/YjbR family)
MTMAAERSESSAADRIRAICLGFPDAEEKPFGGHTSPAFRVRDKMFLVISENGEYCSCKAPPGVQQMLVDSDPSRYFVPPYVGSKGWVGFRLRPDGGTDEDGLAELAELAEESYRLVAPQRLVTALDQQARDATA